MLDSMIDPEVDEKHEAMIMHYDEFYEKGTTTFSSHDDSTVISHDDIVDDILSSDSVRTLLEKIISETVVDADISNIRIEYQKTLDRLMLKAEQEFCK